MKVGIILAALIVYTITTSVAYAEEFDIRFLPEKLVEGSQAKMQVFIVEGDQIIPKKITDLTITSLDSSILHIEKVQDTSSFVTDVTVKAGKPGTTTLYLAAPGLDAKEIPVTIYGNKNHASTLLVKITPDTFTTSGPSEGYISVELADEDDYPVIAKEDTVVSLNTANRDIIELASQNLLIKKGEYFADTKFTIKKSGEAIIYTTSQDIETQSSTITVEEDEDLTIKMYTYPTTLSIHDATQGFVIAQLQDSSGRPVIAQKDITVYYKVADSDYSEATNYSTNYKQKSSGYFQIQKGSYLGYTQYSLPEGTEDTYDLTISAEDPLVVETQEITAQDLELMDDKLVQFKTIPVLATGETELIGVLYLEDEDGNPVAAEKDLAIKIDSSDSKALSVEDVMMKTGDQVALVFGKIGNSVPSDLQLRPVVNEGELTDVTVFGPDKDSLELVVEPLIPDVLAGTSFPVVMYLKDGTELTSFPEDNDVFVSPNEYIQIQPKKIVQKDTLVLFDAKSLKKGSTDLSVEVGDFDDTVTIDSLSSDPTSLILDHSESIFVGSNDVFSIQLTNSEGLPTYATSDVVVSLVVKDQGLVDVPATITIPKGSYYVLFDVAPKSAGETEISLLSGELPLVSDEIKITSLAPVLGISGPDSVNASETFMVTVSAKANEKPLVGMNVNWQVDGGIVQISDSQTGTTGEAV
ncbi:MAG: hypothetical protein HZC29_05580, partial [Thaumarchaeota archaeon]|nr:hypothetical protein [Nitrososphaerota archaeon]